MAAVAHDLVADVERLALAETCAPSASGRPLGGDQRRLVHPTQRRYLCFFHHRYLEFRRPEFNGVARSVGCRDEDVAWELPAYADGADPEAVEHAPFAYVTLPSEEVAQRIMERCLLAKYLLEVWAEGETWEELRASFDALPSAVSEAWVAKDVRFCVRVEGHGFRLHGMHEVNELLQRLRFIPFTGKVDLKTPTASFQLLLADPDRCPAGIPCPDRRMWFGRVVATSDRSRVVQYQLTERVYIGPTSMDAEMAFLMCHQACVRRGSLVFDPFVGTGSILVAAAHYGAKVVGGDIDPRVIKVGKQVAGRGQVAVRDNFQQYGLEQPAGLLRMDAHAPPFRSGLQEVFHAIVTDPPYGVRAGGRKSASRPDALVKDPDTHIPSTDPYHLTECLHDLLDLAARLLVQGGRLVYFFPALLEVYTPEEVPGHPALRLVANCEQALTHRYSRRLVTMEKVAAYDAAVAAAHRAAAPVLAMDALREQLVAGDDGFSGCVVHAAPARAHRRYRTKLC